MKKIIKLVFFTTFIMFFFSCEKHLEVIPKSSITIASMWEDSNDARGAMYGMYNQWRSAYSSGTGFGNYLLWGEHRTGVITNGNATGHFHAGRHWENSLIPDDQGVDWGVVYTLINDCNLILKYVPQIDFADEREKDYIIGNAYFLRAWSYFMIARVWGDAPVLLKPHESSGQEGMYPYREPVEDVFSQAEKDIEQAASLISEGWIRGKGIASLETVKMLKTDIYLWRARVNGKDVLDKANTAVDYVLNSNNYSLHDDYREVFEDDNNAENIWSIVRHSDEAPASTSFVPITIQIPSRLRNNPIPVGGSTQWYNITETFRDFMHEKPYDSRASVNAAEYQDEEFYELWHDKYTGTLNGESRIEDSDWRVYRYAEAILFKAEILNELNRTQEAIEYLNIIAKRAYDQENYYPSTLSKAEVDDLILEERIKEFSLEGKAWFDYIRFGQAFNRIETLQGKENVQNILLFPVSYNTINRNRNIKQTPGYD